MLLWQQRQTDSGQRLECEGGGDLSELRNHQPAVYDDEYDQCQLVNIIQVVNTCTTIVGAGSTSTFTLYT